MCQVSKSHSWRIFEPNASLYDSGVYVFSLYIMILISHLVGNNLEVLSPQNVHE